MDLITGFLPASYRGIACDAIPVVVDRFSKMVSFIPCRGTVDAVELEQSALERIIARLSTPRGSSSQTETPPSLHPIEELYARTLRLTDYS